MPTFYTIYHKDRVNQVGGVLVAFHNSIPSQCCHTNNSIEMISVLLNTRPKLLLICLYIPPNCTSEFQQETLHAISNIQDVRTIMSYLGILIPLTLIAMRRITFLSQSLQYTKSSQLSAILQLIKQAIYLTLYLQMLLIELVTS